MSGAQNFWARRRADVAAEAEAERAALDAAAADAEKAAFDDMPDVDVLAALDLPDPDALKQGDDFTVFLAKAVPDQIRRRALRALWRSNPVLANVDMLVDYGEDFTDSAMAVENMQTAYQVGKGMLKHVQEMARQAEERANPPDPEPEIEEEAAEEDVLMAAAEKVEGDADTGERVSMPGVFEPEPEVEEVDDTPHPRRMKFRFEETA